VKLLFIQKLSLFTLGPASISAFIKSKGHECDILLASEEKNLIEKIRQYSPDIIGFSCTTGEHIWVLEMAEKIKKTFNVPIILGGPHPTFFPEVLENPYVDIICIGEGEHATLELLDKMSRKQDITKIKNLWVKEDNNIYKNPVRPLISNLDELPFPDRDVYYKYNFLRKLKLKNFISGRGCPYNCTFCFNHSIQKIYANKGKYVRRRSVKNMIDEIIEVKRKYGLKYITFSDDTFILDKKWLEEFLSEYRSKINLPFSCNVRANLIDEDLVRLLKKSNCYVVSMGVESGDEELRNIVLKKGVTDKQIRDAARLFRKYNLRFKTFNMIALPGETFYKTFENINLNIEIKPTIAGAAILQPYPKLEITDYAIKKGLLDSDPFSQKFGISRTDKSSTILKMNERDKQRFENLQCFYPLIVKFPILRPYIRSLINLPPNKVFKYIEKLTYGILSKRLYKIDLIDSINLALRSGYL
jgi:anaerobic magnesium-protoporphyrin IX monomethyl ester cyclase